MGIGIGQLLVILLIILLLFGAGKIPKLMQDFGKGIKALKNELDDSAEDSEDKKNKQE